MTEVATLATSTMRPKRRYTRIRPALHAQIYRLKGRGLTHEEIANRLRISECSVSRALRKPLSPTQFSDMSRRCGLSKVDKQAARERVKDILMEGLVGFVHPLLDLLDDTLAKHDTRAFIDVVTAIERLDRIMDRVAGVGRRVTHEGMQQQPAVDFKTLVAQLLEKNS